MRRTISLLFAASVVLFHVVPGVAAPADLGTSIGDGGTVTSDVTRAPLDSSAQGDLPAAGDLDVAFSDDGKALTAFPEGDAIAGAVAIQVDGKIVVCGDVGDGLLGLVRYNADGSLDTTFDADGKLVADLGRCHDVAIQSTGNILVASSTGVARYRPDGTRDESFSDDAARSTWARLLMLQDDDGFVAAVGSGIARFTADGDLDPSFGNGGILALAESADVYALQPDGKVLGCFSGRLATTQGIVRMSADGSLDTGFGDAGWASVDLFTTDGWANTIAVQPDGRILVAGGGVDCEGGCLWFSALFRFEVDGTLDVVRWGPGIDAFAIALQPDGMIVLAGTSWRGRFVVARYREGGSLDRSFHGGSVVTAFTDQRVGSAYDVALQEDGKIVVVGAAGGRERMKFAVARYLGT